MLRILTNFQPAMFICVLNSLKLGRSKSMIQQEIWKDIEGYEGLYQVSNLGRVRSLDRLVEYEQRSKLVKRPRQVVFYFLLISTNI